MLSCLMENFLKLVQIVLFIIGKTIYNNKIINNIFKLFG